MRCFQFSQCLGSWVWNVYIGWYHFLSWLHHLKLFILKRNFVYPGDLGFFWSCFFYFVLQNSFLFKIKLIFFSCFAFYLVILSTWSFLRVLTLSLSFAGTLFFCTFFIDFFLWFHHSIFWFLRIDDYIFLVLFRWYQVMRFFFFRI